MKRIIITFTTTLILATVIAAPAYAWLSGYSYRKQISVQATYIDSDLTDFPLYVDITDDSDIGSGMTDTDNYYDIRFTDSDNIVIPYEEESMSISGEVATGHYWVRTDLDSSSGATLYVYYGKSGATDGSNAIGVWDTNYKGVWHMGEAYALDFNGSSDYVDLGTTSGLSTSDTQYSISVWFKGGTQSVNTRFVSDRDGTSSTPILFSVGVVTDGTIFFTIRDDASNIINFVTTGTYDDDEWHHVVAVRDGDDAEIFVDSVSDGTDNASIGTITLSDRKVNICNDAYEGNRWVDGLIDEVRIWSRALSPSEITTLYNGNPVSRTGLVAEYLMNEGEGVAVGDSSGEGNNGDMTGHAASWVRPRAHDSTTNANVGKRVGSMAAAVGGMVANADDFDGTGDYIDMEGVVHDADNDKITMAAWIKLSNITNDDSIGGMRGNPSISSGWTFVFLGATAGDPLRFTLFVVVDQNSSASGISAGAWVHVVVTYDRLRIRFYKNGTQLSSHARTNAVIPATRDLFIGARNNYGTAVSLFDGVIDEVRVNDDVRTADEIKFEYYNIAESDNELTWEGQKDMAANAVFFGITF